MQVNTSDKIIYEHPLNEKTRTLLRLEHLFKQIAYYAPQPNIWDSRAAIDTLLDMTSIFTRADIKADLLKELKRHRGKLDSMRTLPGIDEERLDQVLTEIHQITDQLYGLSGQIGQELRENEFLKGIMQRSSIPGGNCAFDLPAYHFWLQQPPEVRIEELNHWSRTLDQVENAVHLLLSLVRGSTQPTREQANCGLFQQSLDSQSPAQLIRVGLPRESTAFPEISGGKHRFTIRFMEHNNPERPNQVNNSVTFFLNCCIL